MEQKAGVGIAPYFLGGIKLSEENKKIIQITLNKHQQHIRCLDFGNRIFLKVHQTK